MDGRDFSAASSRTAIDLSPGRQTATRVQIVAGREDLQIAFAHAGCICSIQLGAGGVFS